MYTSASGYGVRVYHFNHTLDAKPKGYIREDLYYATLIRKGCLLQDAQILHQTIVHDILHNLVDEINLTAVQIGVV